MKLSLTTLLPIALTAITALAHNHDLEGDELIAYRRTYRHAQDTLNKRCSASMRRRRALSNFKRSARGHPPAVQRSMYESFTRDTSNSSSSNSSSGACILAPEVTQGPYHILGELVRNNVTEDQGGVPLTLTMSFTDVETCEPLSGYWVDFWHANATGIYSGYIEASTGSGGGGGGSGGEPPSGDNSTSASASGSASSMAASSTSTAVDASSSSASASASASSSSDSSTSSDEASMFSSLATDEETFLRGVAQTDSDGAVTFNTIFPGWYVSRAVHIHVRTYASEDGYKADNGTFVATGLGHHTGQVFFNDTLGEALSTISPYSENSLTWEDATKNADDSILVENEEGGWSGIVNIVYVDESDITKGLIGTIEMGVNTTVESEELSDSYWHGTTSTSTSLETATASADATSTA